MSKYRRLANGYDSDHYIKAYGESIARLEQSYILVYYWMMREGFSVADCGYVAIHSVEAAGLGRVFNGKLVECKIMQFVLENDMAVIEREVPHLLGEIDDGLARVIDYTSD